MKSVKITILLLFVLQSFLSAQVVQDVQGKPVFEKSFIDISGSPYLYEEWTRGNVELENHQIFNDLALKYNTYTDEVYYKDPENGGYMSFVVPVKKFDLDKNGEREIYANGFPKINNFSDKTYYQILADGKVKLLFKKYKTLVESKDYNSATSSKSFTTETDYYLFKDNKIERIRPSKKEFLTLFKDKEEQIKAYQKKEVIDYKNNLDLKKLVLFYSSLP